MKGERRMEKRRSESVCVRERDIGKTDRKVERYTSEWVNRQTSR